MNSLNSLYRRIAGLDVHRMLYVLTVLLELDDGTVEKHQRSFGGFKRDRRALVDWLLGLGVGMVVMESTGIYWKSIYAALEQAGIPAMVVNARHVKNVPGRKTDLSDSDGWPNWGGPAWSGRASSRPKTSANCAWSRATGRSWRRPWRARRTACTRSSTTPASSSARWSRTSAASRPAP